MLTPSGDSLRADFINDTDLSRLAERILFFSQIFFGQEIDVRVGPLLRNLRYFPLHRQVAISVVGIGNRERHFLIAPHVPVFDTSLSRVYSDIAPIQVAPDRRNLRAAVSHHGAEMGKGAFSKEISIRLWNRYCHISSSLCDNVNKSGPLIGADRRSESPAWPL